MTSMNETKGKIQTVLTWDSVLLPTSCAFSQVGISNRQE